MATTTAKAGEEYRTKAGDIVLVIFLDVDDSLIYGCIGDEDTIYTWDFDGSFYNKGIYSEMDLKLPAKSLPAPTKNIYSKPSTNANYDYVVKELPTSELIEFKLGE